MSRKSKIDPELKVELVEKYLRDEISITEGCRCKKLSRLTSSENRSSSLHHTLSNHRMNK